MLGPVDHVYYWTRDLDRAVRFYTEVVGFTLTRRAGDGWAELGAGSVRFALHTAMGEGDLPPSGTVVLRVEDLDAARAALAAQGVALDGAAGEVEGVARFATFHDPDANPVQIIEYVR